TTSLRACLERLIDDPALRRRMGTAGRARYEERFTPDRMTDALVDFLSAASSARVPKKQALQPTEPSIGAPVGTPARPAPSGARVMRVPLAASALARHDAVSAAARHTIATLRASGQYEVSVLTAHSDFAELDAHVVDGVGQLLLHPAFLAA